MDSGNAPFRNERWASYGETYHTIFRTPMDHSIGEVLPNTAWAKSCETRQHGGIVSRHFLPDSCRHADLPVTYPHDAQLDYFRIAQDAGAITWRFEGVRNGLFDQSCDLLWPGYVDRMTGAADFALAAVDIPHCGSELKGNSQAPNCYGCLSNRNVSIPEARSTGFSRKDKCPVGIPTLFAVGIESANS
jgi:hypothetical protein